jgi:hypothetical protein
MIKKHIKTSYPNYHNKSTADSRTIVAIRQETEPIFEDRGIVANAAENVLDLSSVIFICIAGFLDLRDNLLPGKIAK